MTATQSGRLNIIVQEDEGALLRADQRFDLLKALLDKGYAVSCTRSRATAPVASSRAAIVFARFGGRPPSSRHPAVRFEDVDGRDTMALVASVERVREEGGVPPPGTWKPWFPVIDYQRCTNCMQCLSFCLFDVYGVTPEGNIQVRNQTNCKTECPACSRVCPEVAIMFPKYRHGPINGETVGTDDVRREAMKVDISTLLGGDIYSLLRDRSAKAKSRFSKERDDQRALEERKNCLLKLQQALDVPQEVLAALPNEATIRAKMQAALAQSRRVGEGDRS